VRNCSFSTELSEVHILPSNDVCCVHLLNIASNCGRLFG